MAGASGEARTRYLTHVLLCALLACGRAAELGAQDLPFVTYTTADGLPHDGVQRLLQDDLGFLWVGGLTALARFDGEGFRSYGKAEGLDIGTGVNGLRLDAQGNLWIATNGGGIFRFELTNPDHSHRVSQYRLGEGRAPNRVNAILFDRGGRIWAGTDAGLFLAGLDRVFQRVTLSLQDGPPQDAIQVSALAMLDDWIWIGSSAGTYVCQSSPPPLCRPGPVTQAATLLIDASQRLWIGGDHGIEVWVLTDGTATGDAEVIGRGWRVRHLALSSDGVIAGLEDGRVVAIGALGAQTLYLSDRGALVNDVLEDAAGNFWVATTRGLVAVRRQGVTLVSAQGLQSRNLVALRRDHEGQVYAATDDNWVHRIAGERLSATQLVLPAGVRRSAWPSSSILIDRAGQLWFGTANGLFRYPAGLASERPRAFRATSSYRTADGLAGDHVSEVFEDSRGDLWVANVPAEGGTLAQRRRGSARFERLGTADGVPSANQLSGFVEDAFGGIWAALREGGVLRIRQRHAVVFGVPEGFPYLVTATMRDRRGNLWFGGADVVVRVSDPASTNVRAEPVLTDLGTRVLSMVELSSGLIFLGTQDGLLSLDSASGALRRLSSFEGLPPGAIQALAENADGSLLMVVGQRLARLASPSAIPAIADERPPRTLLSTVRVGGRTVALPDAGVEHLEGIEVHSGANHIEVEFLALSRQLGEPLTYEYRLIGASDIWSRASERRVAYPGLAAGRYTFEVRATGAGGTIVSPPATARFVILPPWYRRWWFLTAALAALLAAAYGGHRVRLRQAVYTEQLRSRIATDLHDDIGSSLSQIAILAEVARRRAGTTETVIAEPLNSIATTSRDLVDAMSDIVWAVNPRRDSLADLTRRMHRFAEETLGGVDIELTFTAPPAEIDLKLGADPRRELYLILKESVNNIARHSGASRATIDLQLVRRELRLTITDDGRGFELDVPFEGNGIASMRKRAAAFGGVLVIDAAAGRGTRVSLAVNLRRPRR